jgi:hypothetical protein
LRPDRVAVGVTPPHRKGWPSYPLNE